jgi:hypothetical protein
MRFFRENGDFSILMKDTLTPNEYTLSCPGFLNHEYRDFLDSHESY